MSTRNRQSDTLPIRPVPRRKVMLGLLIAAATISGVVLVAEALRHPAPDAVLPEVDEPGGDPRDEVVCETAREGQERQEPTEPGALVADVTSNELYDCPDIWHGRDVRYRGEVVGAVLQRRTGAWVQLNDDIYGDPLGPLPTHRDYRGGNAGIGVFIPLELARSITFVGGPKAGGDILEVVGTFHRVDQATSEAAVIRAVAGEIMVSGQQIVDPTLPDRRAVALLLVPLGIAAVIGERIVARRR